MANELPKHLEWLRRQPCCECGAQPPSHPHHRPGGGKGRKTHDREAIPLCARCHREFHDLNGRFKGWTRPELRGWHDTHLATICNLLDQEGRPDEEDWQRGWEDIF